MLQVNNLAGFSVLAKLQYTGIAPVLESVSRDIGAASGGTVLTIRGYGFIGGETVTVGGSSATSVSTASNKIICTTPAGTANETPVDIVVTNANGKSTLLAAFEYAPTISTTYVSETFTSGYGPLTVNGTPSIVNVPWPRGSATKCVQMSGSSADTEQSLQINLTNNPMLANTYGVWFQVFYAIPSATMELVETTGQIKILIVRVNNEDPAWMIDAVGTQEDGAGSQMKSIIDVGSNGVLGSLAGTVMGDNIWIEEMQQLTRNSSTSMGRVRRWINGKLIMNTQSSDLGANTTTDEYNPRFGFVFTQAAPAGTLNVYVADLWVADGYREPLE